ncbi:MAG: hypothetical protein KC435_07260 [Thermomicrobiales bacterium]|nr:hypothetical protein [Thermomicrobiales bacterium]
MLKRYPVLSVIAFLVAMTALAVFTQADSHLGNTSAQDATPVATEAPEATSAPADVATPPANKGEDESSSWWSWPADTKFEFWVVLAVLTIVGLVIGLALRRFDRSEDRYIALHNEYLKRGLSVTISQDSTVFERQPPMKTLVPGQKEPPPTPKYNVKITGPAELVLNQEGAYTASVTSADDGTAVDTTNLTIKWSLKDSAHGWTKQAGATVRVLPSVVGTVTLMATIEGAEGEATFDIIVLAEARKDIATLPNPTAGWGTLVTSILILGFAVVIGIIAHEFTAVLTLFGTIAGYAYGRSKPDSE